MRAKLFLVFAMFASTCARAERIAAARGETATSTLDEAKSLPTPRALNFQSFKSDIQPIFLKERPGHARCYGCHSESNRIFRLQKLSHGAADWTEEQSRQNFQTVMQLVVRGEPDSSPLLLHPLAPSAGGDPFHSGRSQFSSQNDPALLILTRCVGGLPAV